VWGAEPLGDEALEEGGAHFTGAETGDFHAGWRGEGQSSLYLRFEPRALSAG
jgi:hypothetical protein